MALDNIRFYITEKCNAKCPNCFNRQSRNNTSSMDIEHFKLLCQHFSAKSSKQIKIMGGEPTIHPDFSVLMRISQQYYERVNLFTNAISDKLYEFVPRENDIVTYNFRFRRLLTPRKLLLEYPGYRNLEIQITPNVIKEKLVDEIIRVSKFAVDRIRPCLTLDCTSNIFSQRDLIVPIYEYVWQVCSQSGIKMGQDHLLPLCYLEGTQIPMPREGANCLLSCAGLIDSSYRFHYCNQYYDNSIPVFKSDGTTESIEVLEKFLILRHKENLQKNFVKGCNICPLYSKLCNGGCFMGNETIQRITSPF